MLPVCLQTQSKNHVSKFSRFGAIEEKGEIQSLTQKMRVKDIDYLIIAKYP